MIGILRRQFYSPCLPQRIRFRATLAHKTGDWVPFGGSDVGIRSSDGGPVVVSVLTGQNRGSFFELEAMIGKIAEDLINTWR